MGLTSNPLDPGDHFFKPDQRGRGFVARAGVAPKKKVIKLEAIFDAPEEPVERLEPFDAQFLLRKNPPTIVCLVVQFDDVEEIGLV